ADPAAIGSEATPEGTSVLSDRRAQQLPWLLVRKMRNSVTAGGSSASFRERPVEGLTSAGRPGPPPWPAGPGARAGGEGWEAAKPHELRLERIRPGAPGRAPDLPPELLYRR